MLRDFRHGPHVRWAAINCDCQTSDSVYVQNLLPLQLRQDTPPSFNGSLSVPELAST